MTLRVYALWPINVDRKLIENRITASAAASSAEAARSLAAEAARTQARRDHEMWLDPRRTSCVDLMDGKGLSEGFIQLHHTPEWGLVLPKPQATSTERI